MGNKFSPTPCVPKILLINIMGEEIIGRQLIFHQHAQNARFERRKQWATAHFSPTHYGQAKGATVHFSPTHAQNACFERRHQWATVQFSPTHYGQRGRRRQGQAMQGKQRGRQFNFHQHACKMHSFDRRHHWTTVQFSPTEALSRLRTFTPTPIDDQWQAVK